MKNCENTGCVSDLIEKCSRISVEVVLNVYEAINENHVPNMHGVLLVMDAPNSMFYKILSSVLHMLPYKLQSAQMLNKMIFNYDSILLKISNSNIY